MNPIRYETRDGIALITIDRPDKRNSLDEAAVQGLHAAWRRFADSDERVAIVTGAGEQAFCAGVDLNAPPRDT
ncbi:MAG TPA: enoyl-CoA hydratase/isomerase family protein, partial [Quisquiliibacterium sp.]|nr:enoyl-CoA hydratase/isomerase family protein [Quisquiliibacterium sp.]